MKVFLKKAMLHFGVYQVKISIHIGTGVNMQMLCIRSCYTQKQTLKTIIMVTAVHSSMRAILHRLSKDTTKQLNVMTPNVLHLFLNLWDITELM